ncbi:hypothetical protein GCM10023083_27850 [Streptomyces phyllanthi]
MDALLGDGSLWSPSRRTSGRTTWRCPITRSSAQEDRRPRRAGGRRRIGCRAVVDTTGILSGWAQQLPAGVAVLRPDKAVYGTSGNPAELEQLLGRLRADFAVREGRPAWTMTA